MKIEGEHFFAFRKQFPLVNSEMYTQFLGLIPQAELPTREQMPTSFQLSRPLDLYINQQVEATINDNLERYNLFFDELDRKKWSLTLGEKGTTILQQVKRGIAEIYFGKCLLAHHTHPLGRLPYPSTQDVTHIINRPNFAFAHLITSPSGWGMTCRVADTEEVLNKRYPRRSLSLLKEFDYDPIRIDRIFSNRSAVADFWMDCGFLYYYSDTPVQGTMVEDRRFKRLN